MGPLQTETRTSISTAVFTVKFKGISLLDEGKAMLSPAMIVGSSTWQLEVAFRANQLSVALTRLHGTLPAKATIWLEQPAHTIASKGPVTVLEDKSFAHRNMLEGRLFQQATNDTATFVVQLAPVGDECDEPVSTCRSSTNAVLEALLFNPAYADVMLIVQGQSIPAHRCLLSSRSKIFHAMFQPQAHAEGIILVGTVVAAREALRFLYTGAVNDVQLCALAPDLLAFACIYQIADLKDYVETYCMATMNMKSAKEIMRTAEKHDRAELRVRCMKFIAAHLKTLRISRHWRLATILWRI